MFSIMKKDLSRLSSSCYVRDIPWGLLWFKKNLVVYHVRMYFAFYYVNVWWHHVYVDYRHKQFIKLLIGYTLLILQLSVSTAWFLSHFLFDYVLSWLILTDDRVQIEMVFFDELFILGGHLAISIINRKCISSYHML